MIHEATATGATVEEALANARAALNAPALADVHTEIISMPTKKILGLFGGSPAKARAYYETPDAPKAAAPKAPAKKAEKAAAPKAQKPAAPKAEAKTEVKAEAKQEVKAEVKKAEAKQEVKAEIKPVAKPAAVSREIRPDDPRVQALKAYNIDVLKAKPETVTLQGIMLRIPDSRNIATNFALGSVKGQNLGFICVEAEGMVSPFLDQQVKITGRKFQVKGWKAPIIWLDEIDRIK